MYTLRISPSIAFEYQQRCIADVIPQLADYSLDAGDKIKIDRMTLDAIIADCRFMADPKAIDCSPAERRAYRALLTQCQSLIKA